MPVVFHAEAEQESDDAATYYERQRAGLGKEFRTELKEAVGRIRRNPKMLPQYRSTRFRKCLLFRFPYTIFFQELDNLIWVAAVAHQKRREGYWLSRTPED
jgi:plasmid stabilization system protein ParE